MDGFQVIGSSRNLKLAGLKKFLIALVDEPRDLAADHVARLGEKSYRIAIAILLDGGRAAVFFYEDTIRRSRGFQDLTPMTTQPSHGFFVRAFDNFFRHGYRYSCGNEQLLSHTVASSGNWGD